MSINEIRNNCVWRLNNIETILANSGKYTEDDYWNAIYEFKTYITNMYNSIYSTTIDNQSIFAEYASTNSLLRMVSCAFGHGYIVEHRILNFTEYSYPVDDVDEGMSINMLVVWRDYVNRLYRSKIKIYNSRYYLVGMIDRCYNLFASLNNMITNSDVNKFDVYQWTLQEVSRNMINTFIHLHEENTREIYFTLCNNDLLTLTSKYAMSGIIDRDIIPELNQYPDNVIIQIIKDYIYCQMNGVFECLFTFIENYMFYEFSLTCNYIRNIQSMLEGIGG